MERGEFRPNRMCEVSSNHAETPDASFASAMLGTLRTRRPKKFFDSGLERVVSVLPVKGLLQR
jgi:hypothetical protein